MCLGGRVNLIQCTEGLLIEGKSIIDDYSYITGLDNQKIMDYHWMEKIFMEEESKLIVWLS